MKMNNEGKSEFKGTWQAPQNQNRSRVVSAFRNLKTGTKLTCAFLAVALIVVGMATVGYVSIKSINAGMATLYADRLVCAQQLGNVNDAELNIQNDLYRCILVPKEREKLEQDIAGHIKIADNNIKQYEATYLVPDEKRGLAEFRSVWTGYLRAVDEIMRQVKAGKTGVALQSVGEGGAVSAAQHAVEQILDDLINVQVRVGITVKQDGDRTFARAVAIMTAAGIIGVLLAIALGILMSRGISIPLIRLTGVMRSVSGSDLDTGSLAGIVLQRDEIGILAGAFTLMTERLKETLEGLHRLNRELMAISNCNQTLLRAKDEQTLLNDICRIICDEAGYRLAWVGYAEHDDDKTVRPVAWGGFDDGYVANAKLSWADDVDCGRGPGGVAIRSGEIVYIQDLTTDPRMTPWRESALQRGYRSTVAMPLKDENANMFGVLLIYSAESNAFTPDEMRLLKELSSDLAFGISVLRTRTERKLAEEEIRILNQELEQRVAERTSLLEIANKELEAFSYSVSHDLRAPLRGIDGFSLALLEDYQEKLDATGKDYIARIRAATKKMDELIDSLLKLSRISRFEMKFEKVNLSLIVQKIMSDLKESDKSRKATFIVPENITTFGDSNLLNVVFENLLSNAWKFTSKKDKTVIEFGVFTENSKTIYYVKDNGVGFDMMYINKLFSAFQRLHSDKEYPGNGVGLTTVQRIIKRHNGEIWVKGEVDKGATFYFTIA